MTAETITPAITRKEEIDQLEAAWERRAQGMGWRKGTATYSKAKLEFFMGADVALKLHGSSVGDMRLMLISIGQ